MCILCCAVCSVRALDTSTVPQAHIKLSCRICHAALLSTFGCWFYCHAVLQTQDGRNVPWGDKSYAQLYGPEGWCSAQAKPAFTWVTLLDLFS